MEMFTGFVFGLHNIEPRSNKNDCSNLFDNLTITPEFLENIILLLKNKDFNFVSMKQFLIDKQNNKECKNIVITIDDGWKGVYKYAFPIFKKYNIPFVFYIATDLIKNGFKNCKLPEMDGMNILCENICKIENNIEKQQIIFKKLWNSFKYKRRFLFWKTNYEIIQGFFKNIEIDFAKYKDESICTQYELKEMVDSGLCELGSHTHNHVHMDRIREKEILRQIVKSNNKIESFCGNKCNYFSYPYGHFNKKSDFLVRKYYSCATIVNTINNRYYITKQDDIYTIPRKFIDMNTKIGDLLQDKYV